MEHIILNNKLECPVVGIGTFMLSPAEAENSVREALKMGYSLVDTANAFDTESESSSDVLVIYFSRTGEQYTVGVIEKGNTAIVAEMIAEETGSSMPDYVVA